MATYPSDRIRQGLPRSPGGSAWPEVAEAVLAEPLVASERDSEPASTVTAAEPAVESVTVRERSESQHAESHTSMASPATVIDQGETQSIPLRRGLPRVEGGEPWPAAETATVPAMVATNAQALDEATTTPATADGTHEAATATPKHADPKPSISPTTPASAAVNGIAATGTAATTGTETVTEEVTLRRGLPRSPGGEPWPTAGTVTVRRAVSTQATVSDTAEAPAEAVLESTLAHPAVEVESAEMAPSVPAAPSEVAPAIVPAARQGLSTASTPPEPPQQPVAELAKSESPSRMPAPKPKREPIMVGNRTLGQWMKLVAMWVVGAVIAAGIIVLAARGVTTLPGVPEFLRRYPGEYELPEFVDPGFPAWARWSHFLNFFLIVLIIRSGLLVRMQQKPDAFFTPKKGGKKVSIYHWMHTSLDVLWLINGAVFVVLLFVSGHWARIVPTSWEVFPNAASAMLQYLTLEWPIEDGWVNYNSLQQLMYFVIVFIAAPLAAITGVRLSQWWPEKIERLNRVYQAPLARALHFPTMLFFVLFIIIHVFLVLTTGALKNLNHMFAGTSEISWLGFWWFVAAVLVTAAVTWAARPLVLAPIAGVFGRVSQR